MNWSRELTKRATFFRADCPSWRMTPISAPFSSRILYSLISSMSLAFWLMTMRW